MWTMKSYRRSAPADWESVHVHNEREEKAKYTSACNRVRPFAYEELNASILLATRRNASKSTKSENPFQPSLTNDRPTRATPTAMTITIFKSVLIAQTIHPFWQSTRRTFHEAARLLGEGNTGGTRAGGAAQGDSFTRREQASEGHYVRQHEADKLATLRADIAVHEARLAAQKDEAEAIRLEVDRVAEQETPRA
ncbi:ATPase inhibitor [Elasticomyces elasticus]|nr:ATPase inhibitor [Elasticomyces elasticus]KAK3619400.1 ATPase inhibitor [Elasticomyces elasticus]KAK4907678.1 ATPase inhibitor [Elasticomyces elasticus]KAK5747898.1 ATPase inhibitor [Elasticomyces elasticus]